MTLLAFLRMCIFFCTFEHLPWLAHLFSPIIQANSLVATPTPCSPYSSSERTCNNELTLFVGVAVVLPLPTKPRALREPYIARNIIRK